MKTRISLMLLIISLNYSNAQNTHIKSNENICYCTGNSPLSTVKLDNNWELLLLLKQPKTLLQLDSLGVDYTVSQLRLMQHWNLLKKDSNGSYKTSIIMLDSIKSKKLRNYSKQLSIDLTKKIKPKVLELKSHLQEINREKSTYSILFSYIIDGMIWDYFENEKLINEKEISLDNPIWDGEFWTLHPKRDFSCGTNSISENGHSIKVNWTEDLIPKMFPFVSRWDLQEKILDDFINKGKLEDKEAYEVFSKFNLFDEDGGFTIPIIVENDENRIYAISKDISATITNYIKEYFEFESLKKEFSFKSNEQVVIILYHEMMWDILYSLENENIIEKPMAFKNPNRTKSEDIGDIVIFIKQ